MLTATFARITTIFLITVCAASCGGGGGTGAGSTTPPSQTIAPSATTPTGPPSGTTASLWLGNVTTLGATATVSQSAPTTYYIRGSYTNAGIASIQASVANGAIAFTITFKSPASLSVGTYTDTITM